MKITVDRMYHLGLGYDCHARIAGTKGKPSIVRVLATGSNSAKCGGWGICSFNAPFSITVFFRPCHGSRFWGNGALGVQLDDGNVAACF
jgi:hypothetical protein